MLSIYHGIAQRIEKFILNNKYNFQKYGMVYFDPFRGNSLKNSVVKRFIVLRSRESPCFVTSFTIFCQFGNFVN